MQQFLLFCTMLIIASEVFSEELRGSQNPKSTKRRTSRFAHRINYSNPNRYMLHSFNFPMFLVPPAYESSDYEAPFLVPLPRCGCEPKCRKENFPRGKNRRFRNRKRFRRKHPRKRHRAPMYPDSFIFDSPESFENFWSSGIQPRRNFTHFSGSGFNSRDFMIRNPKNQYIVCLYPVFIRPVKKGTIDFYKKRFSNLKRQYLINLRNKSKRSARNLIPATGVSANELHENKDKDEGSKCLDKNLETSSRFPHFGSSPSIGKYEALTERPEKEEIGNHHSPYNLNLFNTKANSEMPDNFRYNLYNDLEKYPEGILPPQLNMSADLYSDFLDVTPPSVTIPRITFKYPYDPMLYESSYDYDKFTEKPMGKETFVEENVKRNVENPPVSDIGKVKQMLEEVESMLSFGGSDDNAERRRKTEEKLDSEEKFSGNQIKKEADCNRSVSLKEKIDTVVIPILSQISTDLGKMQNKSFSGSSGTHGSSGTYGSSSANGTTDTSRNSGTSGTNTDNHKKSNIRCSPDGTWMSSVLGLEMTFTTMPNMMLKVKIVSAHDSIVNKKWSIQGLTLSKRGGPLMLAAVYPQKKKIASFIGQCKMCRDQDLIFGSWTIYTCMRRFSDLWRAVETKLDVLKKKKA